MYALTGTHPGSPDKLASFITQPRDQRTGPGQNIVKGLIKLKLQNCNSNEVEVKWNFTVTVREEEDSSRQCSRSMTVTIDGISSSPIKNYSDIGSKISESLIPPSIWKYAIMVPQEEAQWPFSTPGKDKDIFDKIFGLEEENAKAVKLRQEILKLKIEVADQKQSLSKAGLRKKEYRRKEVDKLVTTQSREQCVANSKILQGAIEQTKAKLDPIKERVRLMEAVELHQGKISQLNLSGVLKDLDVPQLQQQKREVEEQIKSASARTAQVTDLERMTEVSGRKLEDLLIKLSNKQKEIEDSERVSLEKDQLLRNINLFVHDEAATYAEIQNRIGLNERKCAQLQKRKEALSIELGVERRRKSQLEQGQNNPGDDYMNISTAAWKFLQQLYADQTSKLKDFSKKRAKVINEERTTDTVAAQMDKIDNDISKIERLKGKIEAYEDVIQLLLEGPPCSECCATQSNRVQILSNKIADLESQLKTVQSLEKLMDRRAMVCSLLQEESAAEEFRSFLEEMDEVLSATASVQSDSEPDLDIITTGSITDSGFEPSMSRESRENGRLQLTSSRKRRHSEIEDTVVDEQSNLLIDNIKSLTDETQVLRENKISLEGLWKQEQRIGAGISELKATEKKCKEEIDTLKATIKEGTAQIRDLREKETDLHKNLNKLENTLKSNEVMEISKQELSKAQNQLELLGADEASSLRTLDRVKDLQKRIETHLNVEQEELNLVENEIAKETGVLTSIKIELEKTYRNAISDYEALLSQLNGTIESLESANAEAVNLRANIIARHQSGVKSINDSLRSLWSELYPHTDFATAVELVAKRKKDELNQPILYDYHFQMCFQPAQGKMKMRGCSSLGEKYWATLMIRCALAEQFASSCPIFGFDAPEMNLDPAVVDQMIKLFDRLAVSGKQLIITSPDSEFLQKVKAGLTSVSTTSYILNKVNGCSSIQYLQDE